MGGAGHDALLGDIHTSAILYCTCMYMYVQYIHTGSLQPASSLHLCAEKSHTIGLWRSHSALRMHMISCVLHAISSIRSQPLYSASALPQSTPLPAYIHKYIHLMPSDFDFTRLCSRRALPLRWALVQNIPAAQIETIHQSDRTRLVAGRKVHIQVFDSIRIVRFDEFVLVCA